MVVILRRSRKPRRFDGICFHSQQCAEKYLKARLAEAELYFPKCHDLVQLLNLCLPVEPLWSPMTGPLKDLSEAAVRFRYPGEWADRTIASLAYESCTQMRSLARQSLGLDP